MSNKLLKHLPCSLGSHNQLSTAASLTFPSPSLPLLFHPQSVQVPHHLLHHRHPAVSAMTEGGTVAEKGVRWRFSGAICAEHQTLGISSRVSHSTYLPLTPVILVQSAHRWPRLQPDLISLFLGWHHLLFFFFFFFMSATSLLNLHKSKAGNYKLLYKCCFNRSVCYVKDWERGAERDWD